MPPVRRALRPESGSISVRCNGGPPRALRWMDVVGWVMWFAGLWL